MFTEQQTAALDAKLSVSNVKKNQKGFDYVEGWFAISEANRIFGFDGWHRATIDIKCVAERERELGRQKDAGWGVSYIARVRITVGEITRDGCGAGHGYDRDLGLAHESALKEAETDAMKRALMTFGNPFGLCLYDKMKTDVIDETKQLPAPQAALPAPSPDMVSAFVERRLIDMKSYGTETDLLVWWNSDAEKDARRTIDLDAASLKTLMDAVAARRGVLNPQHRKAA